MPMLLRSSLALVFDRHLNSTRGHQFSTTPIDIPLPISRFCFRLHPLVSRSSRASSRVSENRAEGKKKGERFVLAGKNGRRDERDRDTSEEMLIATLVISLGFSSIREYGGVSMNAGEKERGGKERNRSNARSRCYPLRWKVF